MEMVKDDLLILLVDLLLLAQDDVALTLYGASFKLGVLEDVRDDVDGLGDVLAEALGIVDGLLARRIRIKMRAEILYFDFKRMLRATASALEGHMFEEVGCTIGRIRLGTGTSVYPYTHGGGLSMWMCLRRDRKTI
jgi:hypothetical protein